MIIKSLSGKILYQSNARTMRVLLEECAEKGVCLDYADLRKMKLNNCYLDGLKARKASFWGCDLEGVDIAAADLRGADFRCSNLKDVCMAQSDMRGCDMRGSYFSRTILEGSRLGNVQISCPSFWDCDLSGVTDLHGATFHHRGEAAVPFVEIPLIVRGLEKTLVFEGRYCFWGDALYDGGDMPPVLERSLHALRSKIEKAIKSGNSRNAKTHIPKIIKNGFEN